MSQQIKKLENRIDYANYQIEKYKKEVLQCQAKIEKLKVLTNNLPSNIIFNRDHYFDKNKDFTKVTNSHVVATDRTITYSLYYYESLNNGKHKVYVHKHCVLTSNKYNYDYKSGKQKNSYLITDPNSIGYLNDLNESCKKEFIEKIIKGTTKYYQGIINAISRTKNTQHATYSHEVDPSSYNYDEFLRLKSMLVFK